MNQNRFDATYPFVTQKPNKEIDKEFDEVNTILRNN